MITPDQDLIAEIIFLSDGFFYIIKGFKDAKFLGKKVVNLYKLC